MNGQDSLIAILGHMGAIPKELAVELDARCRKCDHTSGKVCGDCPSDNLGVKLALAQGYVTEAQITEAQGIQRRLRSSSQREQLEAVTSIAMHSRQATRKTSQTLYATARRVAMKSNHHGFKAVGEH